MIGSVVGFWDKINPFFVFHLLSKVAEQHREIGAVLLYT
nr:MAG TPA: hypothetical protein [Caudoviricetes sp.]